MNLIKTAKKTIYSTVKPLYRVLKHSVKTDNNTVLFMAYLGKGYLCNPKYIHLEMMNDPFFKDVNFIWVSKDPNLQIEGAKVVKYNSPEYFYYLAKSKIWIINCKLPECVSKKDSQFYIQTWHGTCLKRLAHDIETKEEITFYRSGISKEEMTRSYDVDVERYDCIISPNQFTSDKYESAFKVPTTKIREFGYPRNDYLVNITTEETEGLKAKYNIPSDKSVILYSPTWRDNHFNEKGYVFNLECDFKKWKEQLGDKYVVLFKPHYLISNKFSNEGLEDFLYCIDESVDINELYVISDLLITDYSSVFFDYTILDRPVLFYMYDLENYKDNLRGFYLDIYSELPGPIIEDENTLLETIRSGEFYNNETMATFRNRFHSLENGLASKTVIEQIIKPILSGEQSKTEEE